MTRLTLLFPMFLTACQPCEGPIVVYISGMDDTAVVTWAEAGSDDFTACSDGIDPAYADCGPDDDGAAGTFVVRVAWNDQVWEQEVTIINDKSCTENTSVEFNYEADTGADDTGADDTGAP